MSDVADGGVNGADVQTDGEVNVEAPAVAVSGTDRMESSGKSKRILNLILYVCYEMPVFIFLLILFCIVKASVADMRAVLFSLGGYEITWVEMLYALAAFISLGEIYKISEPGVRNTKEAIFMMVAAIVYLILFILGAAQVPGFVFLFSNSEFFMLTAIGWAGAIMALIINPRTAQRSIHSGAD